MEATYPDCRRNQPQRGISFHHERKQLPYYYDLRLVGNYSSIFSPHKAGPAGRGNVSSGYIATCYVGLLRLRTPHREPVVSEDHDARARFHMFTCARGSASVGLVCNRVRIFEDRSRFGAMACHPRADWVERPLVGGGTDRGKLIVDATI